jgi:hypothetical protein
MPAANGEFDITNYRALGGLSTEYCAEGLSGLAGDVRYIATAADTARRDLVVEVADVSNGGRIPQISVDQLAAGRVIDDNGITSLLDISLLTLFAFGLLAYPLIRKQQALSRGSALSLPIPD